MDKPSSDPDKTLDVGTAADLERYPHPFVTTDVALLTVEGRALKALLLKRTDPPFEGKWALPGGFMNIDEAPAAAAARILESKVGLRGVFVEQLATFADPDRDPRGRVLTIAYLALVAPEQLNEIALDRSDRVLAELEVPWSGETGGPVDALRSSEQTVTGRERLPLGFDHAEIIGTAVKRIRGKLDYTPIGFQLLPERFTLRRLQDVHETLLGQELNKDSFRRRMLASGELEHTGEHERDVDHRPAELYRFVRRSAL